MKSSVIRFQQDSVHFAEKISDGIHHLYPHGTHFGSVLGNATGTRFNVCTAKRVGCNNSKTLQRRIRDRILVEFFGECWDVRGIESDDAQSHGFAVFSQCVPERQSAHGAKNEGLHAPCDSHQPKTTRQFLGYLIVFHKICSLGMQFIGVSGPKSYHAR